MSFTSLNIVTSGPIRAAAGGMRELAWTLAGNVVLHVSLLAVASIIPVNGAAWMVNVAQNSPRNGDNSIQLSAAFLDSAAASPDEATEAAPAVVMQSLPVNTDGGSELAPREVDVSPRASLPAPQDAVADAESLKEAAAQSRTVPSDAVRREASEHQPPVADSSMDLPREFASQPSQASAAVSSPAASGAPDVLPSEIHNPFPAYPPELLARRIQATVVLTLKIASDGSVAEAAVHRTSGYEAMDQAALAVVKAWKFKPAMRNGQRVETVVRKPFSFEIRG
jgi:periplasmic protein TonB